MLNVNVGVLGHVDCGKTSLGKLLTRKHRSQISHSWLRPLTKVAAPLRTLS